ncbi:MAG: lipoate--protein ligase family protein, partial [Verrucomicrobiota bacterium]
SDCAVVIGKNQNPWRESRLDLMHNEDVPLARRISGGGTVYHDAGNLNYCIIVDRMEYREEQAYNMVLHTLESLGVRAEKTGKSNLSINGLKFSGNAFCFRKNRVLHHGTLLLDTNLKRLTRYLGSMFNSIETHAIRSVPAKVVNLELDVESVSTSLKEHFQAMYGTGRARMLPDCNLQPTPLEPLLEPLLEKQHSDDWKYGATPRFSINACGHHLEVAKGIVVAASGRLPERFLNMPFLLSAFSLPCDID